ncbi:tRNA threonylcarbamoyladenosine dehydratase [Chitinispirillales bacterium ANBcel5]|uniref:tRNA threonylcarbamoyladenosine dehydratase n=1 Tax=Cellulosispirillum alkaliphilum TaxID=3039283 RepID=UPI002A518C2F|nr:tRNA threonylcarbamoyladenosine dehydratase [Chitinispirillales bacterium ANBcel5]
MSLNHAFHRMELLTGSYTLNQLAKTRVILFGVGGVGSWCAEGLIRSGVKNLTIVDSDLVCVTNINRQVQATSKTLGCVKVTELARRLREISADAQITTIQKIYDNDTRESFNLSDYDYVIDAIDSLTSKVTLLESALKAKTTVYSALGASCKLDPTRIKVSSIWDSYGCRLGKLVRKRLRRRGVRGDFKCVWSDEVLPVYAIESGCGTGECFCPKSIRGEEDEEAFIHEWCSSKKQINGSAVHITATYGFMLSGLIIQDVVKRFPTEHTLPSPAATTDKDPLFKQT